MRIKTRVLPPAPSYRPHHLLNKELLAALTKPGERVRLPLAGIEGSTLNAKPGRIRAAADRAGKPVESRSDSDYLYITKRPVHSFVARFAVTGDEEAGHGY